MDIKFIPIDYDYFDFEDKNYIKLIGRTSSGKKICIVDTYEPNFFVILKDEYKTNAEKLSKEIESIKVTRSSRLTRVLKTKIVDKNYLGEKVKAIQVFVTNHKDARDIASEIGDRKEIEIRRKYDISIITKYIKEKNVEPLCWY